MHNAQACKNSYTGKHSKVPRNYKYETFDIATCNHVASTKNHLQAIVT